jgi:segregation and condensation protein A
MSDAAGFRVTLGDFSGPLDLFCALVESREVDVSSFRLTDVLSQYVEYLLVTKRATLMEIAEFFFLATGLLMRKVRALMPGAREESREEDVSEDGEDTWEDESRIETALRRFRPYRTAAGALAEMKERRERYFVRISEECGPPWYDIGDLYGLATLWWGLLKERSLRRSVQPGQAFIEEIPDAAPEEVQVDARMDEICAMIAESEKMSLSSLLRGFESGGLIVTLLALLELSRLGRLSLSQRDVWGDIEIAASDF